MVMAMSGVPKLRCGRLSARTGIDSWYGTVEVSQIVIELVPR